MDLIKKYQHITKEIGKAKDNGVIIGLEANEKNEMIYVVRRNNIINLESYKEAQPKLIPNRGGIKVTIPG